LDTVPTSKEREKLKRFWKKNSTPTQNGNNHMENIYQERKGILSLKKSR
jgi:hypothetical protein